MKEKKEFKKLCPELVDELGELKEQRKELQADEKELVDLAKEFFAEKDSPAKMTVTTLPNGDKKIQKTFKGKDYEAVYSEFPKMDVSWKDEYETLWKKVNGKKGWDKHVRKLPHKQSSQLDVNAR